MADRPEPSGPCLRRRRLRDPVACKSSSFVTTLIMGLYTIARWLAGKLDSVRRATFDNTMLFWHYTVGQGLVGLLVVHGFPRLTGGV